MSPPFSAPLARASLLQGKEDGEDEEEEEEESGGGGADSKPAVRGAEVVEADSVRGLGRVISLGARRSEKEITIQSGKSDALYFIHSSPRGIVSWA